MFLGSEILSDIRYTGDDRNTECVVDERKEQILSDVAHHGVAKVRLQNWQQEKRPVRINANSRERAKLKRPFHNASSLKGLGTVYER